MSSNIDVCMHIMIRLSITSSSSTAHSYIHFSNFAWMNRSGSSGLCMMVVDQGSVATAIADVVQKINIGNRILPIFEKIDEVKKLGYLKYQAN